MRGHIAKIRFEAAGKGATKTQGTEVEVGGMVLSGVHKLVLTAEPNDIWRAEIHCNVELCGELVAYLENLQLEADTPAIIKPSKPRRI